MADVVVDGRGLEPPEPLERVLAALDALDPGDRVRFVIDREPVPLYRVLRLNGHRFQTEFEGDGTVHVLIWPQT